MTTAMDDQANPLDMEHLLSVVLPGGLEKSATVHGSKPVMDLLVTLCAKYHLNPSNYTVELLSHNKNNISFKPNSPIGSLEAEKILLKPKGAEEKMIRSPYMPEASVRLLINYNKSHKAVVRVSPRVPLEIILPLVCDKCEFNLDTTILLGDPQSNDVLDLTKTLNDHGLREIYAKNTAHTESGDHQHITKTPELAITPSDIMSSPPAQDLLEKNNQKKTTGFLGLFRRRKKKPDMRGAATNPASPGLNNKQVGMNVSCSTTLFTDVPKKRRAPQPPMGVAQSLPNHLSASHLREPQRSSDSTLRSTKRRAPPPPCANIYQRPQAETEVKGTVHSLTNMKELKESAVSDSVNISLSPLSSPCESQPWSSSSSHRPLAHLHDITDPYLPSFRLRDLNDARCALAKILTTSVSKGALVTRLRNSATFPKLFNTASSISTTQRCSDNGIFCADLEPFPKSNLPINPDWEAPAQRKGMTTFKVVPWKKQTSQDPELNLDAPAHVLVEHDHESEGSQELVQNEIQNVEDLCPLDGLQTESASPSPQLFLQEIPVCDKSASFQTPFHFHRQLCPGSPLSVVVNTGQKEEEEPEVSSEEISTDCSDGDLLCDGQSNTEDQIECVQSTHGRCVSTHLDHCGSDIDERAVEEEVTHVEEKEEDSDSFPPPPSPVMFNEDIEVIEKGKEDIESSTQSSPGGLSSYRQTCAFSEHHRKESPSAMPHQCAAKPRDNISAAPSRFAQAVALAVQRSCLQSHRKASGPHSPGGTHSTLPSPHRSVYQFGA